MIEIKHSCNLKGWIYHVLVNEYLVNAIVAVDCCLDMYNITHEVALTDNYVEVWFKSKVDRRLLIIWIKIDLDGYKYAGLEADPCRLGRFIINLDKV